MIERYYTPIATDGYWEILINLLKEEDKDFRENDSGGVMETYCVYDYDKLLQMNDDDIKKVTLRLVEEAVVPAMKERGWDTESFQYACEQVRIHDYQNKWIGGKWHLMSKIMLERIWSDEVEPYGEFYLKVDALRLR